MVKCRFQALFFFMNCHVKGSIATIQCNMAGMLEDRLRLFRLFSVLSFVGRSFLKLFGLTSVVKRYVCGEVEEIVGVKRKLECDEAGFVGEVESLLYLYPELGNVGQHFNEFSEFSVKCCMPMGTVVMSEREFCRLCGKVLAVEPASHVVVVYHEQRGSYLGSRITKCCRTCKVHEHYGYWTLNGKRQFNEDVLEGHFLLSSEDTAFDLSLLRQCANFLIVGAVPFATFAMAFNRKFGFSSLCNDDEERKINGPAVKRMKR